LIQQSHIFARAASACRLAGGCNCEARHQRRRAERCEDAVLGAEGVKRGLDDRTVWWVGNYFKKDTTICSTRIGAFKMPGGKCE